MKNSILSIALILSLYSCKQTTQGVNQAESEQNMDEEDLNIQFVENDTLINMLEDALEQIPNENLNFNLDVQPIENRHDPDVIDSLKRYSYKQLRIDFYKARNWTKIESATIANPDVPLLGLIGVGMTKDSLEQVLQFPFQEDFIRLGNLEQSKTMTFTFEQNKLKIMDFDGFVE